MSIKEQLERMKFHCPECQFAHSLSTRDVERIQTLFDDIVACIIGEDDEYIPEISENLKASYDGRNHLRKIQREKYKKMKEVT